jgi:two-component system, response regulator YesN
MAHILIADDELLVRMGIESLVDWEDCGHTIIGQAENGYEAYVMVEQLQPDILLTDLYMQPGDGFELITKVRNTFPHIGIIVLSCHNDFDAVRRSMRNGADDFIFKLTLKPIDLLTVIDEVLSLPDRNRLSKPKVQLESTDCCLDNQTLKLLKTEHPFALQDQADGNLSLSNNCNWSWTALIQITDPQYSGKKEQEDETVLSMRKSTDMIIRNNIHSGDCAVFNEYGFWYVFITEQDQVKVKDLLSSIRELIKRYTSLNTAIGYTLLEDSRSPTWKQVSLLSQLKGLTISEGPGIYQLDNSIEEDCIILQPTTHLRKELHRVIDYLTTHFSEPISLSQGADIAGMSENYFSHIFKKEIGWSYVEYVHNLRIQRSIQLLSEGNFLIYEIAGKVGYENANYFSSQFRRITGKRPIDFLGTKKP